jgi:ABC-type Fe3+ transport system permease subunit
MVSFCIGCSVVALLSVEMRFSRSTAGVTITGGGRRDFRVRKVRKRNIVAFACFFLFSFRVFWFCFGCWVRGGEGKVG